MIDKVRVKRQITVFLLFNFIITYALGAIAWLKGGLDKFPATILQMFVPDLVVIGILYFYKQRPYLEELGLKFRGLKYWW